MLKFTQIRELQEKLAEKDGLLTVKLQDEVNEIIKQRQSLSHCLEMNSEPTDKKPRLSLTG